MAYVLGFFAADGTMIRNNRGAHFIEFHVTDKEILEHIRGVMRSDHKISERIRKDGWKLGYRLQLGSKGLFQSLSRLGFTPNKSRSMSLPRIPSEYLGDFMRGYFDGDGCVYFRQHRRKDRGGKLSWFFTVSFTSGSKEFLTQLHHLLLSNRIVKGGRLYEKERGFALVFSRMDSLAIYKLMYNNGSRSIYLERKKRIFDKAVKTLGYLEMQR
jgi:hypothetical protein